MKFFKFAWAALALILLVTPLHTANANFSDTNDPSIVWMKDIMLINGYSDGTFKPNNTITRAEISTILSRLHSPELKVKSFGNERKFNDLSSAQWAEKYVNYLTLFGVIQGYPDKTFKPNNKVTWAESLTILMKMTNNLYDNDKWPSAYVNKAKALGFNLPTDINKPMTRGELASLLYVWQYKDPSMKDKIRLYTSLKLVEQVAIRDKKPELLKVLIFGNFSKGENETIKGTISDLSLAYGNKSGYADITVNPMNNKIEFKSSTEMWSYTW